MPATAWNRSTALRRETWAVFVIVFGVYLTCMFLRVHVYRSNTMTTDNEANQYVPVSIIKTGDMYLDEYIKPDQAWINLSLARNGEHYIPFHPSGNAFLALPFYALAAPFVGNLNAAAFLIWRIAASFYIALGVALLFHANAFFMPDTRTRWMATCFLAFGTPLLGIASQDFYQQGALFFLHAVVLHRLAREAGMSGLMSGNVPAHAGISGSMTGRPGILTFALAFALPLCRPTGWLTVAALVVWSLATDRRSWWTILAAGVPMMAVHMLISLHLTGFVIPMLSPYWMENMKGSTWGGNVFFHIAGFWLSPSFGVLFFAPIGLVMLASAARTALRFRQTDALTKFALFLFIGYVAYIAAYRCWYGGYSYGPRFMIDWLPFGWMLMARQLKRRPPARVLAAGLVLLAWSVLVQVTGAVHANGEWSELYDRGLYENSWFWKMRDGQIIYYLKQWFT